MNGSITLGHLAQGTCVTWGVDALWKWALVGCLTGSPLVIGVEDTEDSKPKDGRR